MIMMGGCIEDDVIRSRKCGGPCICAFVGTEGLCYLDVGGASIEGSELLIWDLELGLIVREDELCTFSALLSEDYLGDAGLRRVGARPVEPESICDEVQGSYGRRGNS